MPANDPGKRYRDFCDCAPCLNGFLEQPPRRAAGTPRAKEREVLDVFPLIRPLLHRLDPELAHEFTLRALEMGVVPPGRAVRDPILATRLFGRELRHPLGMAAGFDKNARVAARLFALGVSWIEIGGVTPRPQAGNPRPRVFRLKADEAVINRMGFPNDGADRVLARLQAQSMPGLTGVNLASNVDSADPLADFLVLAERFAPHADYLTLDISCPNTANGQVFLEPRRLRELLQALRQANPGVTRPALVAKLSPDIADAVLVRLLETLEEFRIDAICIGNTTLQRPDGLRTRIGERGGLSGRPLFAISTAMLRFVRRVVDDRIPLIGTGGILTGEDAYAKIKAGATALQLYTALIYHGPARIARILTEVARLLRRDGYEAISQAVGTDPALAKR